MEPYLKRDEQDKLIGCRKLKNIALRRMSLRSIGNSIDPADPDTPIVGTSWNLNFCLLDAVEGKA